jgi:protein TonB
MRILLSLLGGLITSLGLFYLMANLIGFGKKDLGESSEQVSIDFVRIKRDANTESRRRELPKKPPPPKKAPPVPKTKVASEDSKAPAPDKLNLEMPNMDLGLAGGNGPYLAKGGRYSGNADETPLVRIDPEYPIKARMKGIEGNVKVSFIIGKSGSPLNVEIEEANPPRIFNKAVRKAVLRWKYKPRMADGKPIDSPERITVDFPFKLTEEE